MLEFCLFFFSFSFSIFLPKLNQVKKNVFYILLIFKIRTEVRHTTANIRQGWIQKVSLKSLQLIYFIDLKSISLLHVSSQNLGSMCMISLYYCFFQHNFSIVSKREATSFIQEKSPKTRAPHTNTQKYIPFEFQLHGGGACCS